MSLIKLQGNASGTGAFTIAAPNTNTDRTLTLPDNTGTVLTDQSTVSSTQIASALNASGSAPIYACRAWVSIDGTGTVTIRASGNVSSVVDVGVGQYQVNFATAMQDANYAVTTGFNIPSWNAWIANLAAISASQFTIQLGYGTSPTHGDFDIVNAVVFR